MSPWATALVEERPSPVDRCDDSVSTSRGRNIRVDAEEIRWVVDRFDLLQPSVVFSERSADGLSAIVGGRVVRVHLAEQLRLEAGPERSDPANMLIGRRSVGPLSYRIEIPLLTSRGKRGLRWRRTCRGPVDVKENQRAERRGECPRPFHEG